MARRARIQSAGQTADDVAAFLAKSSDDACCRFLCEAGARGMTKVEMQGMAQHMETLPNKAKPLGPAVFAGHIEAMLGRVG